MARRTWRQLGRDIDMVIVEVWRYHPITWKRIIIFFQELRKAIKGGRVSMAELEHRELMKRYADMRENNGEKN